MRRFATRILGFALPTIGFVMALHVNREASGGAAFDGLASGVAFTLPFAAVTWLRSRLEGNRASARARGLATELAFGSLASLVAWAALWVGWTLPVAQPYRASAFAINCVVMALAALTLPAAARGGRPAPDEEPAEAPLPTL